MESARRYAGLLGPDFTQREYYMYYVKGVQKRSWHDLTVLTCDRAAKVQLPFSFRLEEEITEATLDTDAKSILNFRFYGDIFHVCYDVIFKYVSRCTMCYAIRTSGT